MAVADSSGALRRADHVPPMSAADEAAHRAASFVRPSANTSICPICQRPIISSDHTCSGLSPDGQAVLHDLTARLGLDQATADGIAEYEAWAGGVAA